MPQEENDGVNYLKALRRTTDAPAATAVASARETSSENPAPASQSQPLAGAEKRRSPRYKCEGSAEIREEGHDVRTWASFKDISMHGCYVEAMATYPVGTTLHLKLEANGLQVQAKGIVRVTYPLLGMGIALTEMAADQLERLKQLLGTMSRPTIVMAPPTAGSAATEKTPVIADPTAVLRAIVEFFDKRSMLPREDFLRILRKTHETAAKPQP